MHLSDKYKNLKEQQIKGMTSKYPQYLENENGVKEPIFTGPTTTNSIEGGNWRIKSKLGVPYQNIDSYYSRATLSAISDSFFTFSGGKPNESFAHHNSHFSFSSVMNTKTSNTPQSKLAQFDTQIAQPMLATC